MFEMRRGEKGYYGIVWMAGVAIDRIQVPNMQNASYDPQGELADAELFVQSEFARLLRYRLHGMDNPHMETLRALDVVTWSNDHRGT